jgi:ribose transport system permease protein
MMNAESARHRLLPMFQRYQGLVGLLVLMAVAFFVAPKANVPGNLFGSTFFSARNVEILMGQLAYPGMLAIGATFVILTGGIDLSSGSLLGLLNCVVAMRLAHGSSGPSSIGICLLLGAAIGAAIGAIVSYSKLQPFVVTLAGLVSLRGIAYIYTNNGNISGLGDALDWIESPYLGLPVSGWLLIGMTLLSGLVLAKTVFGRRVYALGGNFEAARYAGVPVNRVRTGAYAANGLCIAMAAIVFTARNHNGQPSAGTGYELDAITAAVVGGASLLGGIGSVFGTFVGALFIVCLNELLILDGINYYAGQGWKGIIILVAVYLQNLGRRK